MQIKIQTFFYTHPQPLKNPHIKITHLVTKQFLTMFKKKNKDIQVHTEIKCNH